MGQVVDINSQRSGYVKYLHKTGWEKGYKIRGKWNGFYECIGILPNADIKFFFKCDLITAAKRRYKELKKINKKISLLTVKKSIKIRNYRDISRKNSPLLKSSDAIIVDTGKLKNIQSMINKMSKEIEKKIKIKYGH